MQPKHDVDFDAWALDSAARLRGGQLSEVDIEGVAEELEEMGKAQKHALGGYLKVLVTHLLRWRYRPGLRGVSWRLSIGNARDEIAELLGRRYPAARNRAALETGLPCSTFPGTCPFSRTQLLDPDDWPD